MFGKNKSVKYVEKDEIRDIINDCYNNFTKEFKPYIKKSNATSVEDAHMVRKECKIINNLIKINGDIKWKKADMKYLVRFKNGLIVEETAQDANVLLKEGKFINILIREDICTKLSNTDGTPSYIGYLVNRYMEERDIGRFMALEKEFDKRADKKRIATSSREINVYGEVRPHEDLDETQSNKRRRNYGTVNGGFNIPEEDIVLLNLINGGPEATSEKIAENFQDMPSSYDNEKIPEEILPEDSKNDRGCLNLIEVEENIE